jgi:hypothetical protein
MLCRRFGDVADIDVNVVTPELRRGWANVPLLEGMARRCHAVGGVRFRFSCEEHVRDTLNLANASASRASVEWRREQVISSPRWDAVGLGTLQVSPNHTEVASEAPIRLDWLGDCIGRRQTKVSSLPC